MKIVKIGLSEGVWSIEVKPENAVSMSLKIKRIGDDFHKAWHKIAESVSELINGKGGEDINRLNSFNVSSKKDADYLSVCGQKTFNGMSGFVKIDSIRLRKTSDAELEEMLKEISMLEDEDKIVAERARYNRYISINEIEESILKLESYLNQNWEGLTSESDSQQMSLDFKEDLEKVKENTLQRIAAFTEGEIEKDLGGDEDKNESIEFLEEGKRVRRKRIVKISEKVSI